jgi:type IV conjugative transfer system protein TraE
MFAEMFSRDRAVAFKIADKLGGSNLILLVLLCFTTYHALTNKVIVAIVPPQLDERVTLAYSSASHAYHLKYAMSTAINMGNVTPASVSTTVAGLEQTFSPAMYHKMKQQMAEQSTALRKSGSTLEFKPKTWEFEPETGKTFVTGKQTVRPLNGQATSKTITYEFSIEVMNYVPWIKNFAIYSGVAHNQRWFSENS